MSLRRSVFVAVMAVGIGSGMSCFGSPIGLPDASCNPAINTPAVGGCTWYNFTANTDNSITAGTSFTNYYIAAPAPPWTLTTSVPTVIRVLDGGHQGDTFSVFDNSVLLGSTSATPIDATHACANDPTGPGTDPAACWNDLLMSRGVFSLAAGSHSITVTWDQRVSGGNSTLQWFEIGVPLPATGVPEPSSFLLFLGSSILLLMFGLARRKANE